MSDIPACMCKDTKLCPNCTACLNCVCASKEGDYEGCFSRTVPRLRARIAELEEALAKADEELEQYR